MVKIFTRAALSACLIVSGFSVPALAQKQVQPVECTLNGLTPDVRRDLGPILLGIGQDGFMGAAALTVQSSVKAVATGCAQKGGWTPRQMKASILYAVVTSAYESTVKLAKGAGIPDGLAEQIYAKLSEADKLDLAQGKITAPIVNVMIATMGEFGIKSPDQLAPGAAKKLGNVIGALIIRDWGAKAFADPSYTNTVLAEML
jgi:hypothetical protein